MKNDRGILSGLIVVGLLALSFNASAIPTPLTIGDTNELGYVQYGIPSGDADRIVYVNHLIGMALGTADTADGQNYTRSTYSFSPLDSAVWAVNLPGTMVTIDLTGGYEYLFAKYDGPNYGSEVWYVGGMTEVTIPATAGGYGLSGTTLFTPGTSVPDGGMTLSLLGGTLLMVECLRRRLR
jgi:hypothetical protein